MQTVFCTHPHGDIHIHIHIRYCVAEKCSIIPPTFNLLFLQPGTNTELRCLHEKKNNPPPRDPGCKTGISGGRAGPFPARFQPVSI